MNKNTIIWFKLSNGKSYYVGEGYVFLSIKPTTTFEEIKSTAKKYSIKGAKIITARLWKEFAWYNEQKNGGRIEQSTYGNLSFIERNNSYGYQQNKLLRL